MTSTLSRPPEPYSPASIFVVSSSLSVRLKGVYDSGMSHRLYARPMLEFIRRHSRFDYD